MGKASNLLLYKKKPISQFNRIKITVNNILFWLRGSEQEAIL